MNKELQSIIRNLENTLDGEPWYGRPVYALLREIDPATVFKKPSGGSHSLIELLYHMITWADFTLMSIRRDSKVDMAVIEKLDWRPIDPTVHNWDEALALYMATHQEIIALLQTKDDAMLKETVEHRKYNFRFLLNGLIQHNIYHAGQIAYLHKQLS